MVKEIRKQDSHIPILFLSARSSANDVVTGFEVGANDYLKKPFGMAELLIRIKVLLGRAYPKESSLKRRSIYFIGKYQFDPSAQTLIYNEKIPLPESKSYDTAPSGSSIRKTLSNRESEILKRLCVNIGNIIEMRQLLIELWGDDSLYNARILHVFITKLRHKLAEDPSVSILNIRGVGYKLVMENPTPASL